ncbi:tyrosyl-DNA phosphodiesterase-domain-containing protein [Mycena leptocephala]|nr:tyrosyl-DNA phosphodiesterase-domain-containing protein [Mycena leptocephala]
MPSYRPPSLPNVFSEEILDGNEEHELQRALALSLEDQNSFIEESNAPTSSNAKAACGSGSTVHRSAKRRLDDSDDEQQKKKQRMLHNKALSEKLRRLQDDVRKNAKRPKLSMKYEGGALRLTRTSGRQRANTPNTVSLEDLIHPNDLRSAFVYSFFIENDLLFQYFPFKTSANPRPYVHVYVGRDITLDSAGYREECTRREFPRFYPCTTSGCAHTKMMVLIYPDFLRVVITSANLMELDVVLGDNMWYIQDFPRRLSPDSEYTETRFEQILRKHVKELGCPDDFQNIYLTPGVKPGSYCGDEATEYGQLRLRRIVRKKILKNYTEANLPKMSFEICVGSVGHLENEDIVKNFLESCAGNRQESIEGEPALKMIFPTLRDVQNSKLGKPGAGNISSHIDWKSLPEKSAEYLKTVFYHYHSKDPGCLFHMKSILALHADAPKRTPLYMYMGSANFLLLRGGQGRDIAGMLETGNWEDIVPYVRPKEADRYKEGEQPFKVSKKNFEAPLDWDGDNDSEDESEDAPSRAVMELVRVLSAVSVLH